MPAHGRAASFTAAHRASLRPPELPRFPGQATLAVMLALLVALALTASPDAALAEAKTHLARGKLDDVLFALQGVKLEGAQQQVGADLLAAAGQKAWAAKDDFLALQFAQMALGHAPAQAVALEVAARVSLKQEQFEAAEDYADRWVRAAPKEVSARAFRAELALNGGDAQGALDVLRELPDGASPKVKALRAQAQTAVAERQAALAQLAQMEADLERAAEAAKKSDLQPANGKRREVILYSTSWCGYCTRARRYLKGKGVDFVEKDIEKDRAAAVELQQKRAAAGIRSGGVPVIDVRGTLVLGFDQPKLEQALSRTK